MTYRGAYRVLLKAWQGNKEAEDYPDFDDINEALTVIDEAVERLEQIKQVWNSEEWCQGIPCNADGLKSLFNYNLDLFNKNLTLDKRVLDLEKENQELKFLLECKSKGNEIIIKKMDLFMKQRDKTIEENERLKQENQELKARCKAIPPLVIKNEKYQKAIDILKDRFDFKFNDENKVIYLFIQGLSLHIYSWVLKSQQEYELLKEVLE